LKTTKAVGIEPERTEQYGQLRRHYAMYINRTAVSALLFLVLSVAASAADITGDWKADLQTPQGTVQVSYSFKQAGETLTGTWQAAQSPTIQISEGKVTGDKVSFVVKIGPDGGMVFAHEGKVTGEEMQLTMKPSGEFPGSTLVAKKVK
jgi:hypothetical protein